MEMIMSKSEEQLECNEEFLGIDKLLRDAWQE